MNTIEVFLEKGIWKIGDDLNDQDLISLKFLDTIFQK